MKLAQALVEAQREADKNAVTMIVVDAPIENAEEDAYGDGPFGYSPQSAKDILFRYGTVVAVLEPGQPVPTQYVLVTSDGNKFATATLSGGKIVPEITQIWPLRYVFSTVPGRYSSASEPEATRDAWSKALRIPLTIKFQSP